jgi:hypothetical protein
MWMRGMCGGSWTPQTSVSDMLLEGAFLQCLTSPWNIGTDIRGGDSCHLCLPWKLGTHGNMVLQNFRTAEDRLDGHCFPTFPIPALQVYPSCPSFPLLPQTPALLAMSGLAFF